MKLDNSPAVTDQPPAETKENEVSIDADIADTPAETQSKAPGESDKKEQPDTENKAPGETDVIETPSDTLNKAPGETKNSTQSQETKDESHDSHVENKRDIVVDENGAKSPDDKPNEHVVTKTKSQEDLDLGIYEDTDDGDDLSDTELELVKLREEKRKREEAEKSEREKNAEVGADGRHGGGSPEPSKRDTDQKPDPGQDQTFLTGGGMEMDAEKDKNEAVQDYINKNILTDPLHAQGVKRKAGFSQSAFSRPDHVTNMSQQLVESINASRLALESREAMFRRAMSLLSARCTSVKQDQVAENGLPFGIQTPKYFYVTQDKPLPMEPLKAWKGYHGNVYFEPISINHLKVDEAELLRARTSVPRTRQRITAKLSSQQQPRLAITDKENKADSRSESRQTTKSTQSNASTRQMAILDRQAIATRFNDSIYEDMIWIEGQENTGSLAVRPRSHADQKAHERDIQYNKERIKKGSVVHKLYEEKKAKQRPRLTVSGGKFTPPTSMSPLLRTQTQYSLSQRLTTNSPDPYHGNAKLPPLDHLRASLKHMDNKPASVAKGYSRAVTLTDEMKPFVKYSHDVMAKFAQQAAL